MSITTILFDLDGTLLPMQQDTFVKAYFKTLSEKMAENGYEPNQFIKAIWVGTSAMIKNDGSEINERVFWNELEKIYGKKIIEDIPKFEDFYKNEFRLVKTACGFNEKSAKIIKELKEKGLKLVLATNPVFPKIATKARIEWAGIDADDFEFYTTYENSSFCKPNPKYYLEIADKVGVKPEECIMVGNDVNEDMVANKIGMSVFLLTDCLINSDNKDISQYKKGSFDKLLEYINHLI